MDCYTTSFHWVFVLLFLTDTVSSQKKVTGFTGQDVILPCSSSDDGNPLGDVTVFWRTNDDRNVYDVLSAKPDLFDQHPQFRDRTSHFPEEYGKGNFSIKLRNVRVSDTGMYDCFIPVVGVHHQLYLTVRVCQLTGKKNLTVPANETKEAQESWRSFLNHSGFVTSLALNALLIFVIIVFAFSALWRRSASHQISDTPAPTSEPTEDQNIHSGISLDSPGVLMGLNTAAILPPCVPLLSAFPVRVRS